MRCWLDHYMSMFDSVELNTTFYRLPSETSVEKWAGTAADRPDFVFALKLGSFGSHRMKLKDAASWLPNHVDRALRLGQHLGPTLVQLPPKWKRNTERLDEFLTVAPRTMRWAVEIRDATWLHDDTYEVLRKHGAALCLHDLIEDHPVVLTTDWTYIRFHGPDAVHHPYRGRYGPDRLWPWADRIADWNGSGVDAYAYFNNDYDANAVVDARTLRDQVTGEG
ncbi:MAG: hypothetical protein JWN99_2864 [Ilumatobacteraceae bacterium]|nr:hypothetical protein [Ilumatobacteraceae bacterium]